MVKIFLFDQWWNNDKYQCECKKSHACQKDYIWNPSTCSCENGEYLASTVNELAIMCDYRVIRRRNKNYFNKF